MNFVLVHGAWHGSWCWNKIKPLLEERGHQVIAPDLPLSDSLDAYAGNVIEVVKGAPAPVVLVGHSMAGAVVSLVAEALPDRIERLVFLAAFAPQDGESINDSARLNLASALRDNLVVDDKGLVTVKPDVIPRAFYHDCEQVDIDEAIRLLRPQNPAAFSARLALSGASYGRVAKQYIECIEDQAIHVSLQRSMAEAAGCTLINSLRTSHSPFLSAPAALVALIERTGIKDARV